MDWFKQNPFIGALLLVAALLVAAAGYFLSGALGRYAEQEAAYAENKATLERLHATKPFPSAENVGNAKDELQEARRVLAEIAHSVRVTEPVATPTAFQDDLRKMVNDIQSRAQAANVALGDEFYLGFNDYQTQLPSEAAAPRLAQQVHSIHKIASILIDERVQAIGSIARERLAIEAPAGDKPGKPAADNVLPDLVLAPFNVNFTADQTSFRRAFNRILDVQPPVIVRLVGISNSAPVAPDKFTESASPATSASPFAGAPGDAPEEAANKPVFGREVLAVNLGLASITGSNQTADKERK